MKGFGPSHFSFNSPKGRCPACEGEDDAGRDAVPRGPVVAVRGVRAGPALRRRSARSALRGKSIADVLELSVDAALEFLAARPRAVEILRTLSEVGLGYMSLGQSSTTLSGGEAQRALQVGQRAVPGGDPARAERRGARRAFDRPARVRRRQARARARAARRRGSRGDLIEHHTGLLALCDELLELGPGGGEAGGRVIAQGTPEELARDPRRSPGRSSRATGARTRRSPRKTTHTHAEVLR